MIKHIKYLLLCCVLLATVGLGAQETESKAAAVKSIVAQNPDGPSKESVLDEDVNVGYGFQKRRRVTAALSTVKGDELRRSSVPTPSLSLYGMLTGLVVEDKTGEFGAFTPNFFIRGRATMGSASNVPIVLVDGFERSVDDLSLDDIASVTVLKDAAATAIYGMRGANGVILIDTRRGREGRVRFNVDFEQGFQTPFRMPEFVSSSEFVKYYNQALRNDGMEPKYNESAIYPDNQWQKELVRSFAPSSELNLSADGGNKIARYYVSLGYMRNKGLFDRGDEESEKYTTEPHYDRINFRTNLDVVAIRNLDIKLDVAGQIVERNMPRQASSSIWDMMWKYPQHEFPMFLPNGNLGGTAAFQSNVFGYLNNSGYRKVQDRFIHTRLSGEYHFQGAVKGLSVGASYAYDNGWNVVQSFTKTFAVQEILGQDDAGEPVYSNLIGKNSSISYGIGNDTQSRRENFEAFARYERTFDGHEVNAMVLYHQDKLVTDASEPVGTQYIAAHAGYAYKSKYLADVSLSYSGSEAFARKHRFVLFPAVSLGWVLSEENFLKDSKGVNFLKLRASAGIVGNSQLGSDARFAYRYTSSTLGNNYYFGISPDGVTGRKPTRLPNPDMEAEKAFKADVGIDAQLFRSLHLSAGYFYENRYDILTSQASEISSVIGIPLANINAGKTTTHGMELSAAYNKELGRGWSLTAGLNLLWYRNEVKEKLETVLPENSTYQYQVGHPIGSTLELIAEGIFQTQEEIDRSPIQQFGPVQPGDIRYRDVNNDGFIDDYDRVWNDGYNTPNLDMSLTLGVAWKGIDFSAQLHYQDGKDLYLGETPTLFWPIRSNVNRMMKWVADRNPWTEQVGEKSHYPRLTTVGSSNNYRRSTFWIVNGEQMRVRRLELGYTLPQHLTRKIAISRLRLYVRAMNPFLLDHLKTVDPAAMAGEPLLRSYYLGCNITF